MFFICYYESKTLLKKGGYINCENAIYKNTINATNTVIRSYINYLQNNAVLFSSDEVREKDLEFYY